MGRKPKASTEDEKKIMANEQRRLGKEFFICKRFLVRLMIIFSKFPFAKAAPVINQQRREEYAENAPAIRAARAEGE